ncbi:hypothetical protein T261_5376 [Streptomyces lydicus]|nr:hypothetical protein T261_5376 [Streptomyces lydicus]
MRKLHQVALVFAAAGGLSAIGIGASSADVPMAYNGAASPPVPQPDGPQAWSASQATSHASGSHASPQQDAPQGAAPQESGAQVSPQLNPQLSPQISPQVSSPTAPQAAPQGSLLGGGMQDQNNLFRPYQECSPQSLLDANVPVGLLAAPQTSGVHCTQANGQTNSQSNAYAHAHAR